MGFLYLSADLVISSNGFVVVVYIKCYPFIRCQAKPKNLFIIFILNLINTVYKTLKMKLNILTSKCDWNCYEIIFLCKLRLTFYEIIVLCC